MMNISRYLFVIFVSGIFFISVSAVCAQQRLPATVPQSASSGEEGDKAGINVIDSVITDPKTVKKSKPRSAPKIEPGDNFQPRPDTKLEPGDNFQPRQGTRGTVFNDTEEAGPYRVY